MGCYIKNCISRGTYRVYYSGTSTSRSLKGTKKKFDTSKL